MRVAQVVKNIISGVSQQPAILRHMEQLQEQVNGFSTEADGLQKRPPTVHVAELSLDTSKRPKIHVIDRDDREKYILAFDGTTVKVWDVAGVAKKVTVESANYLKTNNPLNDIRVITIADHTFIVNKAIKTQMDTGRKSPTGINDGATVYVKSGQYGRKYEVIIADTLVATFTTPNGDKPEHTTEIGTNNIAQKLVDQIRAKGYEVTYYGGESWFVVRKMNGKNIRVRDGFNSQAISAFKQNVQKFSDLPRNHINGYIVKVYGESSSDDDYYLKYNASTLLWEECPAPNITVAFNASTMPHKLVRQADGSFKFQTIQWSQRESGDEDSNPTPSFVGRTISDIFSYRNRLGVVSGESVILSKSGDYWNYWVDSATTIVDTDPIDMNVSHNQITELYSAVPFNQDLYLFSRNTQFILTADSALSPKNAQLKQVTEFQSDPNIKPIGVGRNLYYTSKRSNHTTVREYYAVYDGNNGKDSNNITSHIPNYIPNNVYSLIACENENLLMALSTGATNTIYVYKYLYVQEQKLQASWSKWVFSGEVIGADFIGSTLYLVIKRNGKVFLEKLLINFNTKDFSSEPYRCLIDRKTEVTLAGTYNDYLSTYRWDAKYHFKDTKDKKYYMVLTDGRVFESNEDGVIECTNTENLTGKKAIVGVAYTMNIELSTLYLKRVEQTGTEYLQNYRLVLQDMELQYADSGEFTVNVSTTGKPKRNYKFTSRILGHAQNKLGVHPIITGAFRVPLHGKNTDTRISISNDSPLPSSFVGYTWRGNVTYRSRQV
ncbi:hypothetical protein [Veillonella intestinalis]|uniref:phage nozzle protein n=1 Tax=Veillonella intestinalis TaxID=2941341 RepID=UPI002040A5C2|nr:hypothetical protein [Veillonella intestinalis]